MKAEHVAPYYGQAWSIERWAAQLTRQLRGSYSRPFIVSMDERPFAYVELYRASRDVVGRTYSARPHDVGLHVAIGLEEFVGKSMASRIFRAFIHAVFAAEASCTRLVFEPDVGNARVRRACTKAGLTYLGEVQLPHKKAALFVQPRSAEDLPTFDSATLGK